MEDAKELNQEKEVESATEEIIKPNQQEDDNQLQEQQQHHNHHELQQQKEQEKQIAIPGETQQEKIQDPQVNEYAQNDEDDDDDDEEKETSQKLVIDIPDDDEEEEKEEDDDEVIALDDTPEEVPPKKEIEKVSPKPVVETVITLSDGEEDVTTNETVSKPGKVQKRRSMGASSANEEDHYRLKRRKINAAGAPKLPLTGYVRYMNDRRESMRKEHPAKTHIEHTKLIGEEWHSLPSDIKSTYLKAADVDKQRYVKELNSFLKARPDILASELAKNKARKPAESNSPNLTAATATSTATKSASKDKAQTNETSKVSKDTGKDKMNKEIGPIPSTSQQAVAEKTNNEKNKCKRTRTPTPPTTSTNATTSATIPAAPPSTSSGSFSTGTNTPGEIPIFTNEFLEHNKIFDMELRSLRKSKTDLELQNSVLEKHVENMKFGVEKMITENNELEEKNRLLEIYLDKLKKKLALALGALPLPSAPHGATVDNIEKYMQDLYKMSTSNSTGPATLNKAKDIIRKLDLQIQL